MDSYATMAPDIEKRTEAARMQIQKIFELNKRFGTDFQYLSLALRHGQQRDLLSKEEFDELEELNRHANKAKHEGLGASSSELWDASLMVSEAADAAAEDQTPCEELGNAIGALETNLALYLGRSLVKNEPRYKFMHRPSNMGDFVSGVHLDMLQPPRSFVGDAYRRKQDAKHSAALQALNWLSSQLAAPPSPVASTNQAGCDDHPGTPASPQTAEEDAGGAAVFEAVEDVEQLTRRFEELAQRLKGNTDELGGQVQRLAADLDALATQGAQQMHASEEAADRFQKLSSDIEVLFRRVDEVEGKAETSVSACNSEASDRFQKLSSNVEVLARRVDAVEGRVEAAASACIGEVQQNRLQILSEQSRLPQASPGELVHIPSEEEILKVLTDAQEPLEVRKIFLLCHDLTEKNKMPPGKKSAMNACLYRMQKDGKVIGVGGKWSASGRKVTRAPQSSTASSGSAEIPTKEAVKNYLDRASGPQTVHDIFRACNGLSAKHSMGADKKKAMNRLLHTMREKGLAEGSEGKWTSRGYLGG